MKLNEPKVSQYSIRVLSDVGSLIEGTLGLMLRLSPSSVDEPHSYITNADSTVSAEQLEVSCGVAASSRLLPGSAGQRRHHNWWGGAELPEGLADQHSQQQDSSTQTDRMQGQQDRSSRRCSSR